MDINSGEDHIREEARVWRERAERLQARVKALEDACRTMDKTQIAIALAATEQGEKDE